MSNKLAPVTIILIITTMIIIIHCIYKPLFIIKSKSATDTNKIKKKYMLINTNKTWCFFRRKLLIFQTDIITLSLFN